LHAALLLCFVTFAAGASYDTGSGEDEFSTEQTIVLEGLTQFGGNEEVVEAIETPPVQEATPPQPLEEIKPELNDVIAATESTRSEEVAKDVPKPVKEEKPVEVAVQEQAPTVATTQVVSFTPTTGYLGAANFTYTITNGVNSPISFSGIPRVFVFDTTGALVYTGSPFEQEFERSLRKATQGASGAGAAKPSGLDALKKPGA